MPRSNRRPRSRLFLVILIGVVVLFLCAGEYLVIDSDPRPADLITVLSGNDSVRLEKAAQLYLDGYAQSILLTNTGRNYGDYQTPYNQLQVEQLQALNVPGGAIFLSDFIAKNTGQEATAIVERMVELNAKSVIIVTDAWHLRRTRIIYSDTFANTGYDVQYVGADRSEFSALTWWASVQGWRTVSGEYARIIGYYIKRETHIPDYPILRFFRDRPTAGPEE